MEDASDSEVNHIQDHHVEYEEMQFLSEMDEVALPFRDLTFAGCLN